MTLYKVRFSSSPVPRSISNQTSSNPQRFMVLEDSLEKRFLESGMHAMQRRSGGMKSTPDVFVITSLDVVIHHDKKLGEGGFGQVFQGDWQGTSVAVKVLDRGTPPFVSFRPYNPSPCIIEMDVSFRCFRRR